jgi:hypothetical protein
MNQTPVYFGDWEVRSCVKMVSDIERNKREGATGFGPVFVVLAMPTAGVEGGWDVERSLNSGHIPKQVVVLPRKLRTYLYSFGIQ